ncbi:hypothetical protein [Paenibacillus sp. Mc5Re-14]|uniref:hypothetical protein n=1 Tax=Paenibacillus sp. Mc5Re-14 TaxID=1030529 RepID=UPI000A789E89|nr:hypothetical protein [Paenibacillus sp. Mc5Re-14]
MGVVLKIKGDNLTIEDLQEMKENIEEAITKKKKEMALAMSGWLEDVIRDGKERIVDQEYFLEVTDLSEVLFIKWYVNHKLKQRDYLPKYIHKCTSKKVPETTYVFDDSKKSIGLSAGKKHALVIHDESLPYLKEEFEEWSWKQ